MSITLLIEFLLLNHQVALAFRIKRIRKAMAPAVDIFRNWTFKMHISLKTTSATGHRVSSSKALKNMFFMFRLRSLNTLTIALYRAMTLFELLFEVLTCLTCWLTYLLQEEIYYPKTVTWLCLFQCDC